MRDFSTNKPLSRWIRCVVVPGLMLLSAWAEPRPASAANVNAEWILMQPFTPESFSDDPERNPFAKGLLPCLLFVGALMLACGKTE